MTTMMRFPDLHPADVQGLHAIGASRPVLEALRPAREAIHWPDRTLLHAGPTYTSRDRVALPVLHSAAAAAVFEGWAADLQDGRRRVLDGEIALAPAQDHGAVVPLAGVLSPSQQVLCVRDAAGNGRPAHAALNGGSGPAIRLGLPGHEVVDHLRWINGALADELRARIDRPIDLCALADRALLEGDDCHGRTMAGSRAWLAELGMERRPPPDELARFLDQAPGFFLNLWMAASLCMLSAAEGIAACSIVTGMGANGVQAGLRLAAAPRRWHVADALPPRGVLGEGFEGVEVLPAIGDSEIVEAFGLGGMALGYAPLLAEPLLAGRPAEDDPSPLLLAAHHPAFAHSGAWFGLPARRVAATGAVPRVALGMLDRAGQRGRVGGGLWHAPRALFDAALAELTSASPSAPDSH